MTARKPPDRPTAEEAVTAFRHVIVDHLGGQRPRTADPESARIAAAQDSDLLNSSPDVEFDRMTALAARLFDVPVAVISIVGENRVWLKSRQGLDVAELDREQGLGATGTLHDEILVIEDVTTDPRTAALPRSRSSGFRFYAGAPLITSDGHNLGSFAIADTRPRRLEAEQITALQDLAALALHVMELRRAARRAAVGGPGHDD